MSLASSFEEANANETYILLIEGHQNPKAAMVILTAAKQRAAQGLPSLAARNKATTGEITRSRDRDVVGIKRPRVWCTPMAANIPFAVNERGMLHQTLQRACMARRNSALRQHLFRDQYRRRYADTPACSKMVDPRAARTCTAARRRT